MNKTCPTTTLTTVSQKLVLSTVAFLIFAVPFSLGQPQLVVGSLVNSFLFLGALYIPSNLLLPFIMIPGLAVLARGIIFGPFTFYLIYLLPFIWLGNLILVKFFKSLFNQTNNYWLASITATILKYFSLFLASLILVKLKIIPNLFLTTMGIIQLITALIGAVLAYGIKCYLCLSHESGKLYK